LILLVSGIAAFETIFLFNTKSTIYQYPLWKTYQVYLEILEQHAELSILHRALWFWSIQRNKQPKAI